MEGGLLSSKDLAPHYGDAAWMYLFQDFSGSDDDRRAERIAVRFGITSWPQHLLIDPTDLSIVGDTGRTLESFSAAIKGAPRIRGKARPTPKELAGFDALADQIQTSETIELAAQHLEHPDIVVRYCAVARLAEEKPEVVAAAAVDLLAVEHDQLRTLVCRALRAAPSGEAAALLERLLETPKGSRNPNRLRCDLARTLGACGDQGSLAILGSFAVGGSPNNTLTGNCIDAIHSIARRLESEAKLGDGAQKRALKKAQGQAIELLIASFPAPDGPPPEGETAEETERQTRIRLAREERIRNLAEQVHDALAELTGRKRPFPEVYGPESRAGLVEFWSEGH